MISGFVNSVITLFAHHPKETTVCILLIVIVVKYL